jgi:hypothetical protein
MRANWLIAALVVVLLIGSTLTVVADSATGLLSPPPQEPEGTGLSGIVDTIRDTIQDKPLLAAVIGIGALLLIILIVALVIVLLRGRGGRAEEYTAEDFDQTYRPDAVWSAGPTTPGAPAMGLPAEDPTQLATSDWASPAVARPGVAPPSVRPAPEPQVPAAGGTRIIERAPQHLAMLVDKSRPDRRYDLKGTTNIGRTPENHIVLDDSTVSRQHAWIKVQGEDWVVFDVGSANGTFVNDERVEEPRLLKSGDVVRFGEVKLVFTQVY